MDFLITQLREYTLKQERERGGGYKKTSYWPSECTGCNRVIYWRWKGEKSTNPVDVIGLQIMSIGNKVEQQLVDDWTKMGIVIPPPTGSFQHRVEIEREGIKITGKIDAIIKQKLKTGELIEVPVEVKSFYGDFQERLINQLQPNEGYLKQLAIYMDALDKNIGILYMVNRGNGHQFQFILTRKAGIFRLKGINYENEILKSDKPIIQFNINDTYKYFSEINKDVVANKVPKAIFQYKYPVTEKMLKSQYSTALTNARMGRAVIGDWQCKYCSYKDKCLKHEKCDHGYSKEEQEKIMELTKGYTTAQWRK